mmetsp:Transcript_82522/g.230102  ORF Transcript_82522/g.230102 Transcript_82522/m.230102 type:complete len:88 (-) Transcript_82522:6-269(-)
MPQGAAKPKATCKVISSSLPCKYFGSAKGCMFGDSCAFQHKDAHAVAPCKWMLESGTCKMGDGCFFRHIDLKMPQTKVKGKGKGKGD